ncbi:carbohydrate ABC transporter permease [Auraticoccus monumenti]|uniref:Carbohydrate ABC transporter membrane protein 1, CUT1 family n=1 Tax=Auraticoccus monumenti TaxID=675864 RepID=A0A1G6T5R7_9ACTN|nr:sugar ABC transporter permease [Auraticoccus monumenti]SDD24418.1 carbohydrate ABC transporter membrane protein 1, CUT1 family [Auraticoccus monumenti]
MTTLTAPGAPVTRSGRRRRRGLGTILVFLTPAVLAILLLRVVPFLGAVRSTLYTRDGVGLLATEEFSGLANYVTLFSDPMFRDTLVRTLLFNLVLNPLQIALAMLVALLLTQRLPGRGLWRTAVFIPCTIPLVGSSIAWGVALRPDGPVNGIFSAVGIGPQPFFTSPTQALTSIMVVASWVGIGYWMLFLIAGLNDISDDLYEAASLDGAGAWHRFWSITLPMMRRPLLFVLVADTVANFVLFVPLQLLTNGGPESSTTLLMFDAYRRTYTYSSPNLGATSTVVLTLVMLIIVAVQFRLLRDRD